MFVTIGTEIVGNFRKFTRDQLARFDLAIKNPQRIGVDLSLTIRTKIFSVAIG
jgi:hypothetical protein